MVGINSKAWKGTAAMSTARILDGRLLQRSVLFVGVVAISVLTTLLVERLANPTPVAAQGGQPQVIRATAFELVGPGDSVLARLSPGGSGNGNLSLFDTAGNRRAAMAGNGTFFVFDEDGTTLRFEAGYSQTAGASGTPPVNGVALAPDGTVGVLSGCTGTVTC